jgi:cephalosporin hydroxylase
VPIIQIPQDVYAFQETILNLKVDLIIKTSIARCSSLQLSASLAALLDVAYFTNSDGPEKNLPKRKDFSLDIKI